MSLHLGKHGFAESLKKAMWGLFLPLFGLFGVCKNCARWNWYKLEHFKERRVVTAHEPRKGQVKGRAQNQ